jgi:O-antigen/teichoic acid export membrane protein
VVLNLLIKPTWLLVDFLVQEKVSHEQYGIYAALFSLSFLFIHLTDMGINLYVTKRLSSDQHNYKGIFANSFTFKLIACIIYPFFMVLIGWILGYEKDKLFLLFILSFTQALLQFVLFFRSNFQAKGYFKIDAFASVADKFFLLIIVLPLLYNGITLSTFIYSILISAVVTFVFFYILIIKLFGWIKPQLDIKSISEILRWSFPFAVMGVLYAINEKVDMVMVERLGGVDGQKNAGLYAAAYRWLDAFMMYLWTILPMFFAKFSIHHNNPQEQQKLLNIGQIITFIPMLFVASFVFIYGDKLFWMFTDSTSHEDLSTMTSLLKILFITALMQGCFVIYGTFLNATGHEKNMSKIVLLSILLNIVLNYIFIPISGPFAAAYATLTSTGTVSLYYIYYLYRKDTLKIPLFIIVKLFIISVLFICIFYALTFTELSWFINSIIAGIFLLIFTYIIISRDIKNSLKLN